MATLSYIVQYLKHVITLYIRGLYFIHVHSNNNIIIIAVVFVRVPISWLFIQAIYVDRAIYIIDKDQIIRSVINVAKS